MLKFQKVPEVGSFARFSKLRSSRARPWDTFGCKHLSPLALVVFVYFFNTFNDLHMPFKFHLVAFRSVLGPWPNRPPIPICSLIWPRFAMR